MEPASTPLSMETQVGLYRNVLDTHLNPHGFASVASLILEGARGLAASTARARPLYQAQEEAYQAAGGTDKLAKADPQFRAAYQAYKELKDSLLCSTFSGLFEGRVDSGMIAHSGLIGADLDHLSRAGLSAADVRNACARLPWVALAFISPSGDGVKTFALVDPVPRSDPEHRRAWDQVAEALAAVAPVDLSDPTSKNPSRLCFLAHDPGASFPDPASVTPLPVDLSEPPPPPPRQTRETPPRVSRGGADSELETGREALEHIPPPDSPYNSWLSWLRTLKALGFTVEEAEAWSSRGENYIPGETTRKWDGLTSTRTVEEERDKLRGHAHNLGWRPTERTELGRYDYLNPDGSVRFQVVRYHPKAFVARRPDPDNPGGWVWDLKGTSPIVYRLPELRRADRSETVWIVEGEQDADRLRSLDLTATTAPFGPGKWRKAFAREFRGRRVAVIPDNDPAGIDHAVQVANSLSGVATTVHIIYLPDLPEAEDVSWWLDQGHTPDELQDLLATALPFEPETLDQQESPERERPRLEGVSPAGGGRSHHPAAHRRRTLRLLGGASLLLPPGVQAVDGPHRGQPPAPPAAGPAVPDQRERPALRVPHRPPLQGGLPFRPRGPDPPFLPLRPGIQHGLPGHGPGSGPPDHRQLHFGARQWDRRRPLPPHVEAPALGVPAPGQPPRARPLPAVRQAGQLHLRGQRLRRL